MLKKVFWVHLFCWLSTMGYGQLKTDITNGIYIGKLVYQQKGNIAQYQIQFPIDFPVKYELDAHDDQVFYYFLQKRNFHYSELEDTLIHYYNALYLFKNDTFYSAINFFTRAELDTFCCDGEFHHYLHDSITYKKKRWYTFTFNCNMNIWKKLNGYQIALIYDGYTFVGRRNKIVFLSKRLR